MRQLLDTIKGVYSDINPRNDELSDREAYRLMRRIPYYIIAMGIEGDDYFADFLRYSITHIDDSMGTIHYDERVRMGEIITNAIKSEGMDVIELSKLSGVSSATITSIIRGSAVNITSLQSVLSSLRLKLLTVTEEEYIRRTKLLDEIPEPPIDGGIDEYPRLTLLDELGLSEPINIPVNHISLANAYGHLSILKDIINDPDVIISDFMIDGDHTAKLTKGELSEVVELNVTPSDELAQLLDASNTLNSLETISIPFSSVDGIDEQQVKELFELDNFPGLEISGVDFREESDVLWCDLTLTNGAGDSIVSLITILREETLLEELEITPPLIVEINNIDESIEDAINRIIGDPNVNIDSITITGNDDEFTVILGKGDKTASVECVIVESEALVELRGAGDKITENIANVEFYTDNSESDNLSIIESMIDEYVLVSVTSVNINSDGDSSVVLNSDAGELSVEFTANLIEPTTLLEDLGLDETITITLSKVGDTYRSKLEELINDYDVEISIELDGDNFITTLTKGDKSSTLVGTTVKSQELTELNDAIESLDAPGSIVVNSTYSDVSVGILLTALENSISDYDGALVDSVDYGNDVVSLTLINSAGSIVKDMNIHDPQFVLLPEESGDGGED